MSRIGKMPVELPEGVSLKVEGGEVTVTGPKGTLKRKIPRGIEIEAKDNTVQVLMKKKNLKAKAIYGTFRSHLSNMSKGVAEGWSKVLELVGTGYRSELLGKTLVLNVGYSHLVKIETPEGIEFDVLKTQITVSGIDKEKVGQVAAKIRAVRPPEPYKGKGIKYKEEEIRRKPGKAARAQGVPGA